MKRRALTFTAVLAQILFLSVFACGGEEGKTLKDQKEKGSYSLGYEFGRNLRNSEVATDPEILFAAIRDGLEGKKPSMADNEMRETMKQLRRDAVVRMNWKRGVEAKKNRAEGERFLAANETKEGVITLPSGLQYEVLKEGDGPKPKSSDTVRVAYRGTLLNGTEFDSSFVRGAPEKIRVNGVIKGWTEALKMMKTGSKWRLFVPADLAYGEKQFGRIPPNSTLLFELELLSIDLDASASLKGSESSRVSNPAVEDKSETSEGAKPSKQIPPRDQ